MSPAVLDKVLGKLPCQDDPRLIVGYGNKDDAGVYLLQDGLALVQTTDFFTPIVDDPYVYGQISAANSLSDVYAMGASPLTALSIACFPEDGDLKVLERILRGGMDKMIEAGCTIVGGHTVRDAEIKFGYAVTGTVDPLRVWTNAGARPGDLLLLTKPLGSGVITTALRAGKARRSWVDGAVEIMTRLNRFATVVLRNFHEAVHAATDITGFGLLGHAWEMAEASSAGLRMEVCGIRFMEGAVECARRGYLAGGLRKNREFVGKHVIFADSIPVEYQQLLFDPQTSGGLLVALDKKAAEAARLALEKGGCPAMKIGEVAGHGPPLITVS